ncbi:MAG: 50S ribosomal protein L28 [Deltaproteobacteria bacterium CG07_land_8_20_14_0_80_38_7]|nr:MAG: 50S ribosomal protein L28 [Deltaproteobacteria bacterium CG07_land_8_20_14_0_80_38_7]
MPKQCKICGKGPLFGRNVSHANNKTRKVSVPNLQRVKIKYNGKTLRAQVCTRCIRSKSLEKA